MQILLTIINNRILVCIFLILFIPILVKAQVNSNHVYVNGYYRSNGTYVKGHYRTAPNSTNRDNFSTYGNYNPYTGKSGWIDPDTKSYSYSYTYSNFKPTSSFNYSSTYSLSNSNNTVSKLITDDINLTHWVATNNRYYFYYKGNLVATKYEKRGNDLIVYYDNYAYILPEFESNKDSIKREAIPLVTWKSTDSSYYFYYNEKSVAKETTNEWFGDDLMVYYGNHAYIFEDYKYKKDGNIRLARNIPTWKSDGKSYSFFVDGKSVANKTQNFAFGNDLLVEYNQSIYLLPAFYKESNSNLKTAIELPKWKASGKSYSFYINGISLADKTRNEWLDDNLIVYYNSDGYILMDYTNQKDGKIHVAFPIPTWSRHGNAYNFYLNGESIAYKTTNRWQGDDLIVSYQGKDYILPNFKNISDEQVRFATHYN